jgi:hypothetical protein
MSQRLDAPLLWMNERPVYQLCGAENDGQQGSQGGDGSNNSNSGGAGNGTGDNGAGASGQQGGTDQGQQNNAGSGASTEGQISKAEYDALMARMQAADRAKSVAEAKVAELNAAGQTELQKAQADLVAANQRIKDMETTGQETILTNAFLMVNDKPEWHDASVAMKLLDRSLLVFEGATVKGIDAAVAKLVKDHPYLVKPKTDAGDGKGNNGQTGGGSGGKGNNGQQQQSGTSNNGGNSGGGSGTDRAAMAAKYPAMRGR